MNSTSFFQHIQSHLDQDLPFVAYRKPGEEKVFAWLQHTDDIFIKKSYTESGFVFAPFDTTEKVVFFSENNCDFISKILVDEDLKISSIDLGDVFYNSKNQKFKHNHIALIEQGVNAIHSGSVEKVVLSRKEVCEVEKGLDCILIYKRLLHLYKNAFVYVWFHPKVGIWIGATPEQLVRCEYNEISTMALAGTLAYDPKVKPNWTPKEMKEQQIVTDFIVDQLREIVSDIKVSEVYTARAGNLQHLKTDITAGLAKGKSIKDIIHKLHPTPAVCGLPMREAKAFIDKEEGYSRKYYTGFLGEVNIDKEHFIGSDIYVNLRCMELEKNKAIIYVGGGITKDSDPVKEWEETVRKTMTMKKVLY